MTSVEAVVFDFIGTLAELIDYSLEDSEHKLFRSVVDAGYDVSRKRFLEAYRKVHQKYREIRYGKLIEVTNAVWISEALNLLGCATDPKDEEIKTAVDAFFEDYSKALTLRLSAKSTLQKLSESHKLGLVTNFTYAPVIHGALRKMKIKDFFETTIVSEEVGWRKPHPKIFLEALRKMHVSAHAAVFVGDTPLEDILGAKKLGIRTVFIPSQFNALYDMQKLGQPPDHYISKLSDLLVIFNEKGMHKYT